MDLKQIPVDIGLQAVQLLGDFLCDRLGISRVTVLIGRKESAPRFDFSAESVRIVLPPDRDNRLEHFYHEFAHYFCHVRRTGSPGYPALLERAKHLREEFPLAASAFAEISNMLVDYHDVRYFARKGAFTSAFFLADLPERETANYRALSGPRAEAYKIVYTSLADGAIPGFLSIYFSKGLAGLINRTAGERPLTIQAVFYAAYRVLLGMAVNRAWPPLWEELVLPCHTGDFGERLFGEVTSFWRRLLTDPAEKKDKKKKQGPEPLRRIRLREKDFGSEVKEAFASFVPISFVDAENVEAMEKKYRKALVRRAVKRDFLGKATFRSVSRLPLLKEPLVKSVRREEPVRRIVSRDFDSVWRIDNIVIILGEPLQYPGDAMPGERSIQALAETALRELYRLEGPGTRNELALAFVSGNSFQNSNMNLVTLKASYEDISLLPRETYLEYVKSHILYCRSIPCASRYTSGIDQPVYMGFEQLGNVTGSVVFVTLEDIGDYYFLFRKRLSGVFFVRAAAGEGGGNG